ncbi:MAG: N-acetylglucosamine-6-phosphate deacetylase [Symploca sp. SIO1C2]|nr:N-acetylglucosamine-6-phosphate deacetylase [Symploca sp. SIO1C2]
MTLIVDTIINNARIPGYQGLQQITIDNRGIIEAITPMDREQRRYGDTETRRRGDKDTIPNSQSPIPNPPFSIINFAEDWLSLGGIDLQINGGLGLAFTDLSPTDIEQLGQICQYLWHQGVDAFLPTLVTTSIEKIQRSLAVLSDFITSQPQPAAEILGVHLEGPFLNPQKRGAHPQEHLLPLTIEQMQQVLGDYAPIVKVMTLAPELDPRGEVIPYLRSLGITVSLGHSLATAAQAEAAFKLGASMVTHAFNAMPGLHHREPGLLGAALANPQVYCGMIADGQHVCPTMLQLLLRAGGYEEGIFLVSDALAPIGLPDGVYPWDSRQIEVKHGTARLPDGTLSGTTLPLLVGVENLVQWGICDVESAIALATEAPRQAIGLPGIGIGKPAQLLRWHWDEGTGKLTWKRLS